MKKSFGHRINLREQSSEHAVDVKLKALKESELIEQEKHKGNILEIPLRHIEPDPDQPRKELSNIDELASSIKENGILQPIVVRPIQDDNYVIIFGERRYHAAKLAGLESIPAIIRTGDNAEKILVLQILENSQREDVSPLEEAHAIYKLHAEFGLKQKEIAKLLGRTNDWVNYRVTLYNAPEEVHSLAKEGFINDPKTLNNIQNFLIEAPDKARLFISRIRNGQVRGSYRKAVEVARLNAKTKGTQKEYQIVKSIEERSDLIIIHLNNKRVPLIFQKDQNFILSTGVSSDNL